MNKNKNRRAFFKKSKINRTKRVNKELPKIEIQKVIGTFSKSKSFGFVVPDSRKIPTDIFISKKNFNNAKNNQKVLVEITKQPQNGKKLEGKIVEIIGNANQAGIEMLSLIKEYELPYEFPQTVIEELNYIEEKINLKDVSNRIDLRGKEIFTIDGEDAKDLDDAVSVEKNEDETYTLNVHIADVSNYVKDGSGINKEAIERGTSIYMLDRVIPMLPKKLSNGICSLNAGEDRFTLSISMKINKAGNVVSSKIYKGIINVTERMNYTDVYKILTDSDENVTKRYSKYIKHFKLMQEVAKVLEVRRKANGYLDLDIPESKITLDENGKAIDVGKYETTIANKIIEQFMLTANEEIAKKFNEIKAPFIYRVHEEPDEEKVADLNKFLFDIGYRIETKKGKVEPKEFQKVLEAIKGKEEEKVVSTLILRTLRLARYEDENKGHFGIASKEYCHFTSPIRRYPDLFIHRVISKYLETNFKPYEKIVNKLKAKAKHYAESSSEREQIANKVEREAQDIKKAEYMEDKIGQEYDGIISSVTSFGIFVELENTVEGLIKFENIGNDFYIFDEEKRTLIGQSSKEVYKIGDKIRIKVIEANKVSRRINFAKV